MSQGVNEISRCELRQRKNGGRCRRDGWNTRRRHIADSRFWEMLDVVNEGVIAKGEEPIAFDSDCREGHLRNFSLVINGVATADSAAQPHCQCTCGISRTARPSP